MKPLYMSSANDWLLSSSWYSSHSLIPIGPDSVTRFSTKWRPNASVVERHDVLPSSAHPCVPVTLRNAQPNIASAHMPSCCASDEVIVYLYIRTVSFCRHASDSLRVTVRVALSAASG